MSGRTWASFTGVIPAYGIMLLASIIVILLVTNHNLEYAMFFFVLSLIVLVILQIYRHDHTFKFRFPSIFSKRTVDYFLIGCTGFILVSNYYGNPVPLISLVSSTVALFFLPGWVLLRLIENKGSPFRKIGPIVVLSFCLSAGISALIALFVSYYDILTSWYALPLIYLSISLILLAKKGSSVYGHKNSVQSFSVKYQELEFGTVNVLILTWLLIFFSFVVYIFYPEMAKLPGLDIVRHFSASQGLLLAPDAYGSLYPWYHLLLASLLQLSSAPMLIFQSVIACLSFVLILSFYIMARAYLIDVDTRAPILATVLFTVFAGFGWRYFIDKMEDLSNATNYILEFDSIFNATYFDIGFGQGAWLWFWFRPITLGLTIFFVLVYLLRNQHLTKYKYILISTILLLTLGKIHFPELVIYVIFIVVLAILVPSVRLRLKEAALSGLIALGAYIPLIYLYPRVFSPDYIIYFNQQSSIYLVLGLGMISFAAFILAYYDRRPKLSLKIELKFIHILVIMLATMFVYFVLLFSWLVGSDSFSILDIIGIYAVPWQFYPMLLGLTGILAILSVPLVLKRYRNHPLVIFLVMFILAICIGRGITYFGAEYGFTGYWERRLIIHTFAAASMLAPLGIFAVVHHFDRQLKHRLSVALWPGALKSPHILTVTFLSLLTVVGTLSTFLSIQYQVDSLSQREISINRINSLQETINSDPYSTFLTASSYSKAIGEYSSSGYFIGNWADHIWPSVSPELPLKVLNILNGSFIYVRGNDREIIDNKYPDGYLNSHILKVAPIVYNNGTEMVTYLPRVSVPSSSSSMVLVLPDEGFVNPNFYYAYDILSLGGFNYTTALLSDLPSIREAKIIVAPSEEIASEIMQYRETHDLKFQDLILLNLDGYGRIWSQLTSLRSSDFSRYDNEDELADNNNTQNNDTFSVNWTPGSSGLGYTGTPKVIEKGAYNPLTTGNALRINVEQGSFSQWQISNSIGAPKDLSQFDFVNFDWFGKNNGKWYVLEFYSSPNQSFWYRFQDNWTGWQTVVLPLHVPDGRHDTYGQIFDRYSRSGASWSNIIKIEFKTAASNENRAGDFYLDGFYFGKLSESSTITRNADGYVGKDKSANVSHSQISLSNNVGLLPHLSKPDVTELASFDDTNTNTSVPFILKKEVNTNSNFFYVNVYPIILHQQARPSSNADNNSFGSRGIFSSLAGVLNFLPTNMPESDLSHRTSPFSLISEGTAAFKRALFSGEVKLNSSSVIIDRANSIPLKLDVYADGKRFIFENATRITHITNQSLAVQASHGAILEGRNGFYSSLSTNKSSIKSTGEPSIFLVDYEDNVTNKTNSTTISGNEIQLDLSGPSNILLRQPDVLSNGTAEFDKFYAYGQLYRQIPALDQDVQMEGRISFKIESSDSFIVVRNSSFNVELRGIESLLYRYDELASLSNIFSLPYARHIAIALILLGVIAVYLLDKKEIIRLGVSSRKESRPPE